MGLTARQRMMQPNEHTRRLEGIVGSWTTEMRFWPSEGAQPVPTSGLTTTRRWLTNTRYLMEETLGTVDGAPFQRVALMGFNTMRQHYEYVSLDNLNIGFMPYQTFGEPLDPDGSINMHGIYVEPGFGPEMRGEFRRIRNVFRIESPDRHVAELWVTPPGGKEFREVQFVYTRQR